MNDTPTKPSIIYVNFSTEYGIMGIEFNLNAKAARSTRIQAMLLRVHYSQLGKTENRYRLTSFRTVILFGHRCFTFLRTRTIIIRLTDAFTLFTLVRGTLTVLGTAGSQDLTRTCAIVAFPTAYSRLAQCDSRIALTHTPILLALPTHIHYLGTCGSEASTRTGETVRFANGP